MAQHDRLVQMAQRSEEWHAIASSVTTTTLHRYPIHTAASALDCDDGRRPSRGNRNELRLRGPSRTRPANGVAQPCLSPPKMKPSPTLSASARTMKPWSKAAIRRLRKQCGPRADLRVRCRAGQSRHQPLQVCHPDNWFGRIDAYARGLRLQTARLFLLATKPLVTQTA